MEAAFNELKSKGLNNSENLLKWLKNAKIIDSTKETEAAAKKFFDELPDKTNIELDKFKEVVSKIAAKNKSTLNDLMGKLASSDLENMASTAANAASSAANAMKNLFK